MNLFDTSQGINDTNFMEYYHDAQIAKDAVLNLFSLGYCSLEHRSLAERLFFGICSKVLHDHPQAGLRARRVRGPRGDALGHVLLQLLDLPVDARLVGDRPALPDHADPPARARSPTAAGSWRTSPATPTARSTASSTAGRSRASWSCTPTHGDDY